MSSFPSDWMEWCSNPAIITGAALGVSFLSLALIGEPNELEVFRPASSNGASDDCGQRGVVGGSRCETLLQLAWGVVVHPEHTDLSTSLYLERYPSDMLKETVVPLSTLLRLGEYGGGGGDDDGCFASSQRQDPTWERHDERSTTDGGTEDSGLRSEEHAEFVAIRTRVNWLENRAMQLQREVARHKTAAALAEVTMQRERELRISAEEDARMYKESLEEQYHVRQQLRDVEARLREAAALEASLKREIHQLRNEIAQYEEGTSSSGEENIEQEGYMGERGAEAYGSYARGYR